MELTKFSVHDFNEAYDEFDMSRAKRLGKGGFGKVYLVKHKGNSEWWAAKYQNNSARKVREMHEAEAKFLNALQHDKKKRYIPSLYKYYEKGIHTLLICEYLKGGELFEKINDNTFKLTEDKIIVYTKQMVKALVFIHESRIVHMDIKPQNVMLCDREHDTIKIIDFGLAKQLIRMRDKQGREFYGAKTSFSGTIGFMAPEVLKCTEATEASDFFSMGAVVFMLVTGGHEPFWEKDDQTGIKNTMKADPWRHFKNRRLNVSENARDFVSKLLIKNRDKRLCGKKCLDHDWIRSDLRQASRYEVDKRAIRSYLVRQRWKKLYKGVVFALKIQKAVGGPLLSRSNGGYDRVDGYSRTRVYETMKTVHIPIKLSY